MPLATGSRLGAYEVISLIGAGGMGEVYRARDTKLNRDVALKILPAAFAQNPERLARFKREAQVLAQLNHPNIAAIYGLEEAEGIHAIAMELVEGPTLAARLAAPSGQSSRRTVPSEGEARQAVGVGPHGVLIDADRGLPVAEALIVARQVADALQAAHEKAIIHRDLKPSNIAFTIDGQVKVLDFGLAKFDTPPVDSSEYTNSPTLSLAATQAGVILGTAAYMSPEQARGRTSDKRTDIWAFGCVLFEMLTGRRPFEGEDLTDTIASVVKSEPDWSALPADLPPAVRAMLRRCLEKDRRKRAADVSVILFVLDEPQSVTDRVPAPASASGVSGAVQRPPVWRPAATHAFTLVAAVALTVTVMQLMTRAPLPLAVVRFDVLPPSGERYPGANFIPRFAVSPDGASLVFESGPASGPYQLWIRRLDSTEAQPLRSTTNVADTAMQGMFWFADGRSIGYFDEVARKLKKVDLLTGSVQTLADVLGNQLAGTVNAGGTILLASAGTKGIQRVPSSGGMPVQVTTPSPDQQELVHLWPSFLPDGRHFLYLAQTQARENWGVYVGALDSADRTLLVRTMSMAQFSPPDQVLYVRGDTLVTQTMDMKTFQLVGEPSLVAQPVSVTAAGRAGFSVSETGVLVHSDVPDTAGEPRALTWIDRQGREQPVGAPNRSYRTPRISPDGTRIAVDLQDSDRDIWVWELARRTLTRLTFGPDVDLNPVWTPDSKRIFFSSNAAGAFNLFGIAADGTGSPERVTESLNAQNLSAISPDGTSLVFHEDMGLTGVDIRAVTLGDSRNQRTIVTGNRGQTNGTVSPDGRWIAYTSNESGRFEIFARPYPNTEGGRWLVSTDGGTRPVWARNGRELFYLSLDNALMTVRVEPTATWTAGSPIRLLSNPGFVNSLVGSPTYDVSPDGQRFLVAKPVESQQSPTPARLIVVQNWQEELKRLVPGN